MKSLKRAVSRLIFSIEAATGSRMAKGTDGRVGGRNGATARFVVQSDSRRSGRSGSVFTTYRLPSDTTVVRARDDVHERGLEAARESLRTRRLREVLK